MRRWSINLLCGLSLLIFLLAMGIWVRSYLISDTIGHGTYLIGTDVNGKSSTWWYFESYRDRAPFFHRLVFYYFHGENWKGVDVPLWFFGLFAIPPLLWVRRWRRKGGRGFAVRVVEVAK